jgi:hypothetical protein
MSVGSSLILAAISIATLSSAQTTTVQITYQPATGFFLCKDIGTVCIVEGCEDDGCSTIANDFSENVVDGTTVYTSTAADASLTINGNDSSMVKCDASCDCQDVIDDGDSCNVPFGGRDDPFEGGIVVDGEGEENNSLAATEEQSSSRVTSSVVGGLALAALVPFLP